MKGPMLLFLLVIFLLDHVKGGIGNVGNAGIKVVLTKQGLDYAAWQAVEVMEQKLLNAEIEDLSGSTKRGLGKVEYEFKNTKINSFTKPTADVVVNAGHGLTLSIKGAGISAMGNWRYRFIKVRDSGSFSASASMVSIGVSVKLGRNDNGSPSIVATGCHCSIRDIHIQMRGGASWLYNLIIKFYKNKIKSSFERRICRAAENAINGNGAQTLATLNLQARINDVLTLDYGLSAAPIFAEDYVESNHVGRFLNDDVGENVPEMQAVKDRMISVSISDVSLNSALRVLYKNSKFHFAQEFSSPVVTELVLNVLKEANVPFQGTGMRLSASATSVPIVSVRVGSITVNVEAELRVEILNANGSRSNAFTVKITIRCQIKAGIRGSKVIGSVIEFVPTVSSSSLPSGATNLFNQAVRELVKLLLPLTNEALAVGFPLPAIRGINFKDSVIHLNDHHIVVATNVDVSG